MMRHIETLPSKQMYPYLSLVERKEAEFYHKIDRRRWLVWVKMTYFHRSFRTINGVLGLHQSNNKCILIQFFHADSHYEVYYLLNLYNLLEFPWRLHVCGSISVLAPLIAINLYNWFASHDFSNREEKGLFS